MSDRRRASPAPSRAADHDRPVSTSTRAERLGREGAPRSPAPSPPGATPSSSTRPRTMSSRPTPSESPWTRSPRS